MKIAVGMIVLNGNYVLKQVLESLYPYVSQILISEGPVSYWQQKGFSTSTDGTNDILNEFYDPDKKLSIIHGQFKEKDEQCNAYMSMMHPDTDYIWNVDSDEVFKSQDIEKLINILSNDRFTSVGFKSYSFYGGFDYYLGGFEENYEYLRIRKVYAGSYWKTHRPPTIAHNISHPWADKHLSSEYLWNTHGIRMYHYSYVFPNQVQQKIGYYKAAVSKELCIDNYFENIYLPWVTHPGRRQEIENTYSGVHEFVTSYRGECRTKRFEGSHPEIILKNMSSLQLKFKEQLDAI